MPGQPRQRGEQHGVEEIARRVQLQLRRRLRASRRQTRSPPRTEATGWSPDEITGAFWSACHGGEQAAAELLLARGADVNWVGYDGLTPLDVAHRAGRASTVEWL